jgi:phage tail-like protein
MSAPTDRPREESALPASTLLQYLPAIYHEEPFLGRFLLAFELLLLGHDDFVQPKGAKGLELTVAGIATYFDPYRTPADFLHWLASWTAFTLRFDLDESQQRKFIAKIIPLYRRRGTKRNLEELLQIFTGLETITITDVLLEGGLLPHCFWVEVQQKPGLSEAQRRRIMQIAGAIIELEKPAHTSFELFEAHPALRINSSPPYRTRRP